MELGQSLAILTRPLGRSSALKAELLRRGWSVFECPALEIQAVVADAAMVPRPEAFDLVVFVSRAAVEGYRRQLAGNEALSWPTQTATACVGAATAEAIRQVFGPSVSVFYPNSEDTQDSEALLPLLLESTQPLKKVLIVRGQEGREWLRQGLLARGSEVAVWQAYSRQSAQWSDALGAQLLLCKQNNVKAIWLLTSTEGVQALHKKLASLDLLDWFSQGQFVLTHARIGTALAALISQPVSADNCLVAHPQDESILACFERLRSGEGLNG